MTAVQPWPHFVPLVVFTRGPLVESVHYGALAVVDRTGRLWFALGDVHQPIFMRSSAKPFQLMPLLEAGGAERWGLEDEDIALMVASHSGTERHVERLQDLHRRLGLGPEHLQCGVHPPLDREATLALERRGQQPSPYHHNCSGKHTGMLALARLHGWSLEDYLEPDHPVQQRIRQRVAAMAGLHPDDLVTGTDGCSAPNFALPLYHAAWAYARLVDPQDLEVPVRQAARRIVRAMMAQPFFVAGPQRFDTRLMEAWPGGVVAKGGAEGYQALGLPPEQGRPGLGIAIKIADGDARRRATAVVALAVLEHLGLLPPAVADALRDLGPSPPVFNVRRDRQVGRGYPVFGNRAPGPEAADSPPPEGGHHGRS